MVAMFKQTPASLLSVVGWEDRGAVATNPSDARRKSVLALLRRHVAAECTVEAMASQARAPLAQPVRAHQRRATGAVR